LRLTERRRGKVREDEVRDEELREDVAREPRRDFPRALVRVGRPRAVRLGECRELVEDALRRFLPDVAEVSTVNCFAP